MFKFDAYFVLHLKAFWGGWAESVWLGQYKEQW